MARSDNSAAYAAGAAAPARLNANRLTPALVFLGALSVYVATAPRTLTWAQYGGDGGELIAAAATLGVPHPPGYPLYTLLGHLVYHLPGGTAAFRFHLFSNSAMAAAAAIVALAMLQAGKGRLPHLPAAAAALTFAFAPLVWGQAIIAEVYALNALLVATLIWALRSKRSLFWCALLLGLATTTHLTSLLLLPWVGATLLGELREKPAARGATLRLAALGAALGLLPLAVPPLLAAGNSPVVWGDPTSLQGWWWLVTGQLFRLNVLGLPPAEWPARLLAWGPALLGQFTWLGLPLIVLGVAGAPRPARRHIFYLLGSATAYLLYGFTYSSGDAIVFVLPALLLLSQVLAFALRRQPLLGFLLPLLLLALHFGGLNLRADRDVATLAEEILATAPEGAILLTPGDQSLFTLWYFQLAAGQRPDLILVDSNLLAFDWYRARLGRLFPELVALEEDDLAFFIESNRRLRPFCHADLQTAEPLRCHLFAAPPKPGT